MRFNIANNPIQRIKIVLGKFILITNKNALQGITGGLNMIEVTINLKEVRKKGILKARTRKIVWH